MKHRGHQGLSNTEFAILDALWEANEPLAKPAILARLTNLDWHPNSIHLVLNGLLEKGYLRVAGFIRCGKSHGRSYEPTMSRMEYAAQQALRAVQNLPKNEQILGIISELLRDDELTAETIEAAEKMLHSARSTLEQQA